MEAQGNLQKLEYDVSSMLLCSSREHTAIDVRDVQCLKGNDDAAQMN
jgi:hypothetical protein